MPHPEYPFTGPTGRPRDAVDDMELTNEDTLLPDGYFESRSAEPGTPGDAQDPGEPAHQDFEVDADPFIEEDPLDAAVVTPAIAHRGGGGGTGGGDHPPVNEGGNSHEVHHGSSEAHGSVFGNIFSGIFGTLFYYLGYMAKGAMKLAGQTSWESGGKKTKHDDHGDAAHSHH